MKTVNTFLLISSLLITFTSAYSLQGAWKLTIDDSYEQIKPQTDIVFSFGKSIEEGKIVNRLTVYTCYVLFFSYTISESDILFTYERTLPSRQQCQGEDDKEVRRRIQKVFYTLTVADNLIFLSPSGKTVFKLTKVRNNQLPETLAGIWNAVEVQDRTASIVTKVNGTALSLCQEKALVEYQISNKSDVRFVIIRTQGCSENAYLTALHRSRYYRKRGKQLIFYDSDFSVSFKWEFLRKFDEDDEVASSLVITNSDQSQDSTGGSSQSSNRTQTPQRQSQTQLKPIVQNQSQSSSANRTSSQPQTQQPPPRTQTQTSTQNNQNRSVNAQSNSNNKPQQKLTQTNKSNSSASVSPVQRDSAVNNQSRTTSQPIQESVSISPPSNPLVESNYLSPVAASDITTKWYSPLPQDKMKIFIVTASRILLYGSCGVFYTTFKFGTPQGDRMPIEGIEVKNTSNDCKKEQESIVGALQKLSYVRIQIAGEDRQLKLYESNGRLLRTFTTVPPS